MSLFKILLSISLVQFLISCGPESGASAPSSDYKKDTLTDSIILTSLMTSSSSIQPAVELELYNCEFKVVLNQEKDTTHWSTNDTNFRTPEGYRIGDSWNKIPEDLQNSVGKMLGWGYYIKLESGWQLGFCEGSSCTSKAPDEHSIVGWIFKRA